MTTAKLQIIEYKNRTLLIKSTTNFPKYSPPQSTSYQPNPTNSSRSSYHFSRSTEEKYLVRSAGSGFFSEPTHVGHCEIGHTFSWGLFILQNFLITTIFLELWTSKEILTDGSQAVRHEVCWYAVFQECEGSQETAQLVMKIGNKEVLSGFLWISSLLNVDSCVLC